jgi:hypothetical protein
VTVVVFILRSGTTEQQGHDSLDRSRGELGMAERFSGQPFAHNKVTCMRGSLIDIRRPSEDLSL